MKNDFKRICPRCGQEFSTSQKYRQLCDSCLAESRFRNKLSEHKCESCGVFFVGGPRAKFCPDCRAARKSEYIKKVHRVGPARHIGESDICQRCGATYTVIGGGQKYCPDCTKKARFEKQSAYSRMYHQAHAIMKPPAICPVCGCEFSREGNKRYCSESCRKINEKGSISMNECTFNLLWPEALSQPDADIFVSEWATSSLFDPSPNGPAPDYNKIKEQLQQIHRLAHISLPELRSIAGLTQAAFAKRFCIPRRTVEGWEAKGSCPDYVRLMIAQLLGMQRPK